jgi:DNA-binding protein
MNYVTGLVMQFVQHGASEIVVKARGKFISKAVDVAEVATKRFMQEKVAIKTIGIGSEGFTTPEGRNVRVSTIQIIINKVADIPQQPVMEVMGRQPGSPEARESPSQGSAVIRESEGQESLATESEDQESSDHESTNQASRLF